MQWRELAGSELGEQLAQIRKLVRRGATSTHRFAELAVGVTREFVAREGASFLVEALRFEHDPLPADDKYPEDKSHSEIYGTPPHTEEPASSTIGDLIANCVEQQYEVVLPPPRPAKPATPA